MFQRDAALDHSKETWRPMGSGAAGEALRCLCRGECDGHGPPWDGAAGDPTGGEEGCRHAPAIIGLVFLNGDAQDARPENVISVCCHCWIKTLERRLSKGHAPKQPLSRTDSDS